jgi:hypothetical protein
VIGGSANLNLVIFLDADWGSQADCHSISRYTMRMSKGAVTWSLKKQPVIVLSSTESKYMGLTHATKEILWVKQFLGEILSKSQGSQIYSDNQGAIALAQNNHTMPTPNTSTFATISSATFWTNKTLISLMSLLNKMLPTFLLRYY